MIEDFGAAGANHISIHIEGNSDAQQTLQKIRAMGCRPGIVLKPQTPAEAIADALPLVDIVLVMTVNPGYSGQQFLPQVISKIDQVTKMLHRIKSKALIQVDGGITPENILSVHWAGASVFVSATTIFKNPGGIQAGVHSLRNALRT